MRIAYLTILSGTLLLTACKVEPTPSLDLEGHWIVDHGILENQCQVGATFTDEVMILTFHSTIEGACQPELYDIENAALPIKIDQRSDYRDKEGNPVVNLAVSITQREVEGEILLRETEDRLEGGISFANDPKGLLEPLVGLPYKLTPLADDWFAGLKGMWGGFCEEPTDQSSAAEAEICVAIEFTDKTHFRVIGGGTAEGDSTNSNSSMTQSNNDNEIIIEIAPDELDPAGNWEHFTYAVKHLEQNNESNDIVSMVTFPQSEGFEGLDLIDIEISPGKLILREGGSAPAELPRSITLYPVIVTSD